MLKDHMNTHGIKLYKCRYCQQKYGTWSNLHWHIQKHKIELNDPTAKPQIKQETGPVQCETCLHVFRSKASFRVHKHVMHTNSPGFLCSICGKKFNQRVSLNSHLKVHAGIKKHECELCNKSFFQLGHLKTHMETHNRIKVFVNQCKK